MNYKIKEKFWTAGNDFIIKDGNGNERFFVDGEAFSLGDHLSFQDMNGRNELAQISQKMLGLVPQYEIVKNGRVVAEVRKTFGWFKTNFILDIPGPNDYEIEGSFWKHDFVFRRKGQIAAKVVKSYSWGTDAYGVEIAEGESDVMILCTCIVIDQVLYGK